MLLETISTKHTRATIALAIGTPLFGAQPAVPKERARAGLEGKANGKTDRRKARAALSPSLRLAARKRDKAARELASGNAAVDRRAKNRVKYAPKAKVATAPKKSKKEMRKMAA